MTYAIAAEPWNAAATISTLIPAGAAGCSLWRAPAWCSSPGPNCSTVKPEPEVANGRRRCGAARSLVIVDPGSGRCVAVQDHGFTSHRLTPGPGHGPGPHDGRADVERTIGIAEVHGTSGACSRRRAERLPFVRSRTADRKLGETCPGPADERKVRGAGKAGEPRHNQQCAEARPVSCARHTPAMTI